MTAFNTRIASVIVSLLFVAFVVSMILIIRDFRDHPPYRLTLRPADGKTIVQFANPEEHTVSPEFSVDIEIREKHEIILESGDLSIPGGSIEFHDTTMLPGHFKIRIGKSLFNVMENGIVVDGTDFPWIDARAAASKP